MIYLRLKSVVAGSVMILGMLASLPSFATDCERFLVDDEVNLEYGRLGPVGTLKDWAIADPEKNMLVQHPVNGMSSSQYLLALIMADGNPVPVRNPNLLFTETTFEYPFFINAPKSDPGRIIWASHHQNHAIVSWIQASASGSRIGTNLLLLLGAPGTAKTESATILKLKAAERAQTDPRFVRYSFRWRADKLAKVERLAREGITTMNNLEDPRGDSPLVLLPDSVQNSVLSLAEGATYPLIGMAPRPKLRRPSLFSKYIMDAVIEHEVSQGSLKGHTQLTNRELLDLMNEYVEIVPLAFASDRKFRVLSAENGDIKWSELLLDTNPVISMLNGGVAGHPLAMSYGIIPASSGGVLFIDETGRGNQKYLDRMLEWIQSRTISYGGQTEEFDTMFIGATNDESIERLRQGANGAFIDRSLKVRAPLPVTPTLEIMPINMVMDSLINFEMKPLKKKPSESPVPSAMGMETADDSALAPVEAWMPANLKELFGWSKTGDLKPVGPDGRYALRLKVAGNKYVHVTPHTLLWMDSVVAATRLETQPEKATQLSTKRHVIENPVFFNESERIRFLLGEKSLDPGPREELRQLHLELKEGSKGITNREMGRWLYSAVTFALDRARRENRPPVLDPLAVARAMEEALYQGEVFEVTDESTKLRYKQLGQALWDDIFQGKILNDVIEALGESTGDLQQAYYEVYYMLLAGDNAVEYMRDGTSYRINPEMRATILKHFQEIAGRRLVLDELRHFNPERYPNRRDLQMHPELKLAVQQYLLERKVNDSEFASLADYAATGRGSPDAADRFDKFSQYMSDYLGYEPASARQALLLYGRIKSGMKLFNLSP